MKRMMTLFSITLLLLACVGYAQPEEAATEDSEEDAQSAVADSEAAVEEESSDGEITPLEGDIVVFKKGSELRGVKVVRHSPMFVEIEYLPGEPYLQIPTTQVKEVIYAAEEDDLGGAAEEGLTLGPDIMPGEEVSPEFHSALTAVIATDPLVYEKADYLDVIRKLVADAKVDLDVDENLDALSKEERAFTRTVATGTTLLDFLRKDLAEIAPEVRVILHYDRLTLQKRAAEAAPPEAAPEASLPDAAPEGAPPAL